MVTLVGLLHQQGIHIHLYLDGPADQISNPNKNTYRQSVHHLVGSVSVQPKAILIPSQQIEHLIVTIVSPINRLYLPEEKNHKNLRAGLHLTAWK